MEQTEGNNQKRGIRSAISVLDKSDQRKMFVVSVLQVMLSALDLVGVLAIGLLGALSVAGLKSGAPGERISKLLDYLHLNNLTFQQQVMVLGLGAVFLLVGRTFLSIIYKVIK